MANTISLFLSTPYVRHGPGALSRLPEEIKRLNAERIGILTDRGLADSGIRAKVEDVVEGNLLWYENVEPEPSMESADRTAVFLREQKCDVVVAVGGGSVIDTAKMASVISRNGGRVTDYYSKKLDFLPGLPLIAVPTTAGTGSEATPAAVFRDPDDEVKRGIRSELFMPASAILDPELTVTLPEKLTASTGMDALTHALEAYVSPMATVFSDMAAERSISLIFSHLKTAVEEGGDREARAGMLIGSYLGGVAIAIANVGAVHVLAHTLGGLHKVPHGLANALLLPYVMEFNRNACAEKYAKAARLMGVDIHNLDDDAAARLAVESVSQLARDAGLPPSFQYLGVPESAIDRVPDLCLESQARILSFNPRPVSREDAVRILKQAYEGSGPL